MVSAIAAGFSSPTSRRRKASARATAASVPGPRPSEAQHSVVVLRLLGLSTVSP
jgi:hypothetical protein